jgi:microcystin-dependent protein
MQLAPVIKQKFTDSSGNPLSGGKLYSYTASTTTPQSTYTDQAGGTPNANPVILDSNGEASVWLDPSLSYKFVLKNSSDVTQWTVDSVVGALMPDSVTTAAIADLAVTTAKLAASAVTTAKINDLAVTTAKINDLAVTTGKINDLAVTEAKLAAAVIALLAPAGNIAAYGGTSAPTGWLICDGSRVSRTTYSGLFTAISTRYGTGDGSTTFNLPDLRGTFLRGHVGFSDKTFAPGGVDTGTDVITVTAHGINRTGFPIRFSTTTTLPSGISASTTYYAIYVSADTFKIASTEANAIAGTNIDITSQGSGTHTVTQYIDPDLSSRTAPATGGSTGSTLGSAQAEGTKKNGLTITDPGHTHSLGFYYAGPGDDSGGYPSIETGMYKNSTTNTTLSGGLSNTAGTVLNGGDNETRTRNTTVNWIIKT